MNWTAPEVVEGNPLPLQSSLHCSRADLELYFLLLEGETKENWLALYGTIPILSGKTEGVFQSHWFREHPHIFILSGFIFSGFFSQRYCSCGSFLPSWYVFWKIKESKPSSYPLDQSAPNIIKSFQKAFEKGGFYSLFFLLASFFYLAPEEH